jgi:hypothetical protein
MADLDRARMIELLGRLGAQDDAVVIEAARALDRMLSQSGSSWEALLRPPDDGAAAPATVSEPVTAGETVESNGAIAAADLAEASRLIDRLLARGNLSPTTCEDLAEMKRAIAERRFDAMDSGYVRALARRLGA